MSDAIRRMQTRKPQPESQARARGLRELLADLQASFHQEQYLFSDPLEFVHHYKDKGAPGGIGSPAAARDQEAVALLAALLAYGNVKQIRRSVADALARMAQVSPSPRGFVSALSKADGREAASRAFAGFVHRFNVGADLVLLFRLLGMSWERHGSLGAHFVAYLEPDAPHFGEALGALIAEWREWARREDPATAGGSFGYLLTSPRDGSCCKRWCMFLRWMGRKDSLDPGLWTQGSSLAASFPGGRHLHSSQLVIPLDTHTGRISQYLALTERKSLNWLAALEVTSSLKACDPQDPTRYDFALARLGILDLCQREYRKHICERCQLEKGCRFAQKSSRSLSRRTPPRP